VPLTEDEPTGVGDSALGSLFEHVRDAILLLEEGGLGDCNPAALSLFGADDRAHLFQQGLAGLCADKGEAEPLTAHLEAARREGGHLFQWRIRRLDGDTVPVEVQLSRLPHPGRDRIVASLRDMSARQAFSNGGGAAESLLRNVLSVTDEGFVLHDPRDNRITDINDALIHLMGYSGEEIIGRSIYDFIHPDYIAYMQEKIRQARERGDPVRSYEAVLQHKRGDPVPVQIHAGTAEDEAGNASANFAFITDLTQRYAMEESLRAAKCEAEEANQAKSMFLANMSHELRTPLNAVIGYSDMLREEAEDVGQADFIPDLERIRSAAKHLLSMINDILDFSKIEAGKVELYFETFDLGELCGEVEGTVQPLVTKKGNQLDVACPDTLGALRSDRTRLRQILFNLLSNAAKFTEEGRIALRAWPEDGCVAMAVSDTGIGMSADQLERLFEAFTQADASTTRNYGGTGLGMTITRHFTHLLGGEIYVDSVPGEGSTFTIRLPEEPPEQEEAAAHEANAGGEQRTSG